MKQTKVITRNDLIKQIRRDFGTRFTKADITDILNSLEWTIVEHLASADENNNVSVRLFYGLHIDSVLKPERQKSFLGQYINVPKSIYAKAYLTNYYNRQLNN